jgi:hypothetical protein
MTNFPNVSATTLWATGLLTLLAWAAVGLLDGATFRELIGVPILVATWMSAVVLIDRLVMRRRQSETGRSWSVSSAR